MLYIVEYIYVCLFLSQRTLKIRENPSGDFKKMNRHISKGGWTFSDRDQGWNVSDCSAEAFKVINH